MDTSINITPNRAVKLCAGARASHDGSNITHSVTLKSSLSAVNAVLRCADEHLDEVVVQRVEELPLEAPLKLRVVEIARMQIEVVRVHLHAFIFELDDDLDSFALSAGGKVQQRMLVEAKLGIDAIEAGACGFSHRMIVNCRLKQVQECCTL